MHWPSHLYLAFCYSLGNHSLAFLDSEGVSGKIGLITNPSAHSCKYECSIPSLAQTEALSK